MLPLCRKSILWLLSILMGAAAPTIAHAIVYYGTFDPNDSNYQWSGTHSFDVSPECLETDGWKLTNGENNCAASLIGGSLTLKRLSPTAGPYTLNFQSFPSALNNVLDIWGVYVQNGQVAGIDSYLIGGFQFTGLETFNLGFDAFCGEEGCIAYDTFFIRWESGKAASVPEDLFPGAFAEGSNQSYVAAIGDPTYLYVNGCPPLPSDCTTREVTPGVAATTVTFRTPEPGTLSMLLGGLGAAALVRRRRRRV